MTRATPVFLFHERLSILKADLQAQMRSKIALLQDELKTTMIYVTGDEAR